MPAPDSRTGRPERRWLRRLEWVAWVVAAVLGTGWVTARGLAWAAERRTLAAFRAVEATNAPIQTATAGPAPTVERAVLAEPAIDKKLWDTRRIRAYARAVIQPAPPPMAVLRIPRLRLEAPVLEGTDEWTLDRAVGHIEGTALPGETGNVGIAGHRDGFFRGLKDIASGDVLELALPGRVRRYRVETISIVHQDAVEVLADTPGASRLTLVTCYPFYFVGPAPERFIVHARIE